MKAIKQSKFKVGDQVTCRQREEAYYSGYYGNPICWFEPSDIGIVKQIDVPYVTSNGTFTVVDFMKPPLPNGCQVWRVALNPLNVVKVKKNKKNAVAAS